MDKQHLTDFEKALLVIAHFDLQYHRLQSAAKNLLDTRRRWSSKSQEAVLTAALDELEEVVKESPPDWVHAVRHPSNPPFSDNTP